MKRTLLFYALLLQAGFLLGQGSLQLFDQEGVEFANGQQHRVFVNFADWETVSPELFVKNSSANDISVKIRVEEITAPEGTTNNFCGLGSCFTPGTMETPIEFAVLAGEMIGEEGVFTSHYQANNIEGNAVIRYTYFDVANLTDTISVTYTFVGTASPEPVQLLDYHNNEILNGDVIDITLRDLSIETVSPEFFLRNNTGREVSYLCRRDIIEVVDGSENYFCVFGTCLPPDVGETTRDFILAAGEIATSENAFSAHYSANGNSGNASIRYTMVDTENSADSLSFTLTFSDVTGIEDVVNNANVSVYPNPAIDFVKVNLADLNLNNGRIEIYNALGVLCFEQKFVGNNELTLDLSQFSKGVYLYRIESQGHYTSTSKLILK